MLSFDLHELANLYWVLNDTTENTSVDKCFQCNRDVKKLIQEMMDGDDGWTYHHQFEDMELEITLDEVYKTVNMELPLRLKKK